MATKTAPKAKRASGPTQPEDERKAKAVLLRLLPATTRRLDALAAGWGVNRSEAVTRLVAAQHKGKSDE